MTLLDRYFIGRLLTIGWFAVIVFSICWLAPEILFQVIQGVAQGVLTLDQAFAYLFYQFPEILTYCLPISVLFASVFFFRQMSLSTELTPILASGISFRRLLVPVGVFGLVAGLVFFLTQEFWVSWSAAQIRDLKQKTHFDAKSTFTPQVTFVEKDKAGVMKKFLVISPTAAPGSNRFIFLFYQGQGDTTRIHRILTATAGFWDDAADVWQLKDGVDYLLDANGIYREVEPFENRRIRTSGVAHELLSFPSGNHSEFRLKQLEKYVRLLHKGGQTEDAKYYEVRLFQRYFLPWVAVVFALLGAGIGVERTRSRRNMGLTYAAVLLLMYNILVPVSTTIGSIGLLPTFLAALLPIVLASAGGMGIVRLRQLEG